MLNIEKDLPFLPVVPDQGVDGVTVSHPPNQTRVCGQRDSSKTGNPEKLNNRRTAIS